MITFKQRTGKFNFSKLSETNTTSTLNLLYYKNWKNITHILKEYSDISNGLHGYQPGIIYGKPNSILRECESSPGVWVFDFSNGITIFMFSDGFRKNHFKGTSYEVEIKEDMTEENVIDALTIFFEDFMEKFAKQYSVDFKKLQMFKSKQ